MKIEDCKVCGGTHYGSFECPMPQVHNVDDRRNGNVGSWLVEPLTYDELGPSDIGRTVIYRDHGRAEAGTVTSWRDGVVFARYSRGDTAAGAKAADLVFGVKALMNLHQER
jgi:hypothetical protein